MIDANGDGRERACPWCSTPVTSSTSHCPSCGGSLAQRESIDGVAIAGVTIVDPGHQAYADRPLHIPLPVPSGVGPVSNVTGSMAALASLAEPYGSSLRRDEPADPSSVGEPSDAALEAAERMDREDETG